MKMYDSIVWLQRIGYNAVSTDEPSNFPYFFFIDDHFTKAANEAFWQ